jgi:hypothetical protein
VARVVLINTTSRRITPRALCAAGVLTLGVVLASASVVPAWAKDVLLRVGDVRVPADTIVHGDAIAVGGGAYVDGTVEGDAIALGGSVDVRGHVTGSVRANGGNVVLRSTAVVDGDASAVGGTVTREPGASVGGRPVAPPPSVVPPFPIPNAPGPGPTQPSPPWWFPGIVAAVLWMLHSLFLTAHLFVLVMFIGAAWALAMLFPHAVERFSAVLERDALTALLAGLVAWPVVMVVTVLLAISIVGVPLALSMPAVVIVATQFGLTAVAIVVGKRVHPSEAARETVVGALLLAIAFSIPGVGHLIGLAAVTWGVGAVLLALTETWRFRTRPPDQHLPASPQTHGPTASG